MKNKFILAIIGVLESTLFLVNFASAEIESKCEEYGARCNPQSLMPCCQPNNACQRLGWGASSAIFYCRRLAQLGDECRNDFDCSSTENSFCNSDKKCDCIDNYIEVSGGKCKPLLSGRCSTQKDCVPNHSNCIANKCKCQIGFLTKSYYRCVPTPLNQPCSHDQECLPREHMICSNGICVCRENYVVINETRCAPLLEEYCWADEECAVLNSVCMENKCQCKKRYFPVTKSQCEPTTLEKSCAKDEDCASTMHTKCNTKGKCDCRESNVVVNEAFCSPLLEGYCYSSRNESCFPENSVCSNFQCQCKPNYTQVSNYQCIEKRLGSHCEVDSDCDKVKLSKCSENNTCICPTNLVSIGETVCLNVLGESCVENHECAVQFSTCINYQCKCNTLYRAESEYRCVIDL